MGRLVDLVKASLRRASKTGAPTAETLTPAALKPRRDQPRRDPWYSAAPHIRKLEERRAEYAKAISPKKTRPKR